MRRLLIPCIALLIGAVVTISACGASPSAEEMSMIIPPPAQPPPTPLPTIAEEAQPAEEEHDDVAPPPAPVPTSEAPSRSPLGINISAVSYSNPEWIFVDQFKSSGGWYTQNSTAWDTFEQDRLVLDESGWVRSLPAANDSTVNYRFVGALLTASDNNRHPRGEFIVLYEGEGTIEYQFNVQKDTVRSRPGRDVINVYGAFLLRITVTDPHQTGNYIRNIRVIPPGGICGDDPFAFAASAAACPGAFTSFEKNDGVQMFHPLFLRDLRKFRAIRAMQFLKTNESEIMRWNDRPLLTDARATSGDGAPVEYALFLSNALQADAWLNIPHRADDDYILSLALLAKQLLNTSLKVYVEYSNEVWNGGYPYSIAGNWIEQQGLAAWPGEDPYSARLNWYGKRTSEICAIWKSAWGEEASRVICVMAGQAGNAFVGDEALACPLWARQNGGRPCAENMDAYAIAPYFGGYLGFENYEPTIESWTRDADGGLNQLFNELEAGTLLNDQWNRQGALEGAFALIDQNKPLADRYELDLIAYEGGQHLAAVDAVLFRPIPGATNGESGNVAIQQLFIAANRDPRMGELHRRYLEGWRRRGGKLFSHYSNITTYSKYGSWGIKEYQEEENPPKFRALLDFIEANPCWWEECGNR